MNELTLPIVVMLGLVFGEALIEILFTGLSYEQAMKGCHHYFSELLCANRN
ncbi:hypothetical protein ACM92K_002231 [Cronobacter turicensis]|uniref:hypothetical protein n=1 Tax=unclassified Cronobacter TaxID=2649764 RepID=UPI0013EB4B97|nr:MULTISPECIES: hypothetical protein [unclassified Cronobacter]ELQ6225738.1 hypothetical protein [Cronobacter turicensis]KAF6598039.1 hypothetical protein G9G39_02865 [Cronobacter sp. EKM101R]KAF6598769.1 hypothetical protein G9G38_07465 [Cronobacter sp. EKM102R]